MIMNHHSGSEIPKCLAIMELMKVRQTENKLENVSLSRIVRSAKSDVWTGFSQA